jgi:alkylation response protein AidB-like acyl-CoA dehydrogenase
MTRRRLPTLDGGGFLLADRSASPQLIPEDLGDDARAMARTVDEFWRRDVAPALPALDRHDYEAARRVLRQAAALGLTAMQVPERFGGLALDFPAVMLAVEHLAEDPSYLGWHLGHSGLGTLPLVYYGTDSQRDRYLPRLVSGELLGAFALTEPHAGSDAFDARTRADLAADGRAYVLNGQKAWITNGGAADLFTLFAKVSGEHFTAFLVERAFGVRHGAEERKMGLEGTSTTPLYLDGVRVPAENVLGEVGGGHGVALNVLNCGRLEMGPIAVRGAKRVVAASIAHARSRRVSGRPLAELGAIQEKLAGMAVRLFAAESAAWRAIGLVAAAAEDRADLPHEQAEAAALHAHAIECAVVKVHASEMLDAVADDGVQIHGGYGFHRDALVERAFRDARVNRIYEGTNEVNRLAIVRLLLRRAARGRLPLFEAMAEVAREAPAARPDDGAGNLAARARRLTLSLLHLAYEKYGDRLMSDHQEVTVRLADLAIETFALQATSERARLLGGRGDAVAGVLSALCAHDAAARIERAAREIVMADDDGSSRLLTWIRETIRTEPLDAIGMRRTIAEALPAK